MLLTIFANTESPISKTYTDFAALGIGITQCLLGTNSFQVDGPVTTGYMDTSDATISSWIGSSGLDLTITIADPVNVDYDGRYDGNHINGKSLEAFELLICHVKEPASMYASGSAVEPFYIVM